ncbi:hypothetical protein BDZ45DRAFT_396653 [Acephala macrosclerotiorum]|nr:hypothetical protein BDZ45DRAFT_396653 [Acephala macrosclerotiorum]
MLSYTPLSTVLLMLSSVALTSANSTSPSTCKPISTTPSSPQNCAAATILTSGIALNIADQQHGQSTLPTISSLLPASPRIACHFRSRKIQPPVLHQQRYHDPSSESIHTSSWESDNGCAGNCCKCAVGVIRLDVEYDRDEVCGRGDGQYADGLQKWDCAE